MSTDPEQLQLEMYRTQVSRSEHYESQRAVISNLIMVIAVGSVAVATFDSRLRSSDVPLAVLIILLGLFGWVASTLHYERSRRHGKTAAAYRDKLDKAVPAAEINATRTAAHQELVEKHGKRRARLHHLWDGLHIGIALLGLLLAIFSMIGIGPD